MKRAQRYKRGSVVLDRRRKTWNFLEWVEGKRKTRRIGTLQEYPTKGAAQRAALFTQPLEVSKQKQLSMSELISRYQTERMPERKDTRRSYGVWIDNYIVPKWGNASLSDLRPRAVQLWLESLTLAPKSKAHIRSLLRNLWDYAAWCGDVPQEYRNPMTLVRIKGSSKRLRQPRILTFAEFQQFTNELRMPFRLMAFLSACLGLRISECLALRWCDVDWLGGRLTVERGIVAQNIDDVKTDESRKKLVIDKELLTALKSWKQDTQFGKSSDWIFASPIQHGKLPWSYHYVRKVYLQAGKRAGVGSIATHCMRHTYRSWLDSQGTPLGIQQKLMRHVNIATTMSYGDSFSEDMQQAHSKIVGLALNGLQTDRVAS